SSPVSPPSRISSKKSSANPDVTIINPPPTLSANPTAAWSCVAVCPLATLKNFLASNLVTKPTKRSPPSPASSVTSPVKSPPLATKSISRASASKSSKPTNAKSSASASAKSQQPPPPKPPPADRRPA